MKARSLLGDLADLLPRPKPIPIPYQPRMVYENILSVEQPGAISDAQFPVQQAIFYNPTPAVLLINRTPVTPTSNQYDYAILPYSMFIMSQFDQRQIGSALSGSISTSEKALVSLLHGYADFVQYAQAITPVAPPMPRPVLAVYIIDANGSFVQSAGGQFVIEV